MPEHFRLQHIKAVSVLQDLMSSELSLKINNKEGDFIYTTYINSQAKAGMLLNQIKNLAVPEDHTLCNVNVFSSLDGVMALNIFTFAKNGAVTKHATTAEGERIMKYIEELKAGKHTNDPRAPQYSDALFSEKSMEEYFSRVSSNYVQGDPRRFCIQRALYEQVHGHDGAAVHIESTHSHGTENTSGMSWVTVAAANVLPEVMLRLCASVITARGLDVSRAHLDLVAAPKESESVLMLRLLVSSVAGEKDLTNDPEFIETLRRDLSKIKWLDNTTTELGLNKHPSLGLDKAEVITAYCSMLHGPLCKIDPHNFASINSVIQLVSGNDKYVEIAGSIATLFLDRFNPRRPLPASEFEARSAEIKKRIGVLQFEAVQVVLKKMLESVHATLRTNFFHPNRYALSMRVNPAIMLPEGSNKPMPFGVIFSHGRHFNAFHNRFRDIARGGLRIVTPHNSDQFALESSRQYDEVYNLSYAQQLKNKDIPEGGSKAVVLVNTPAIPSAARSFALRKSVKAFVDSLLDLTVSDSVKNLVDFYGKDELIYLGPDEQVIPADIEWIIQRAAERGYPIPDAFMSSKASNGFNHKEFGVTSEGVVVYLDVALRRVLNIDPKKQPFTVKITGGPDGDVAGNLMNILYREYGDNCKIVAVADGFGCAEDPQGLDRDELLRLFHEALPISHFSTAKLSKEGVCLPTTSEEGLKLRNTMHFRVKTDVFVPAGGRPNTINADNWERFLDDNGKPSSPLIVEGANIFTTPEARQNLFKKGGVTIVKDSSANKVSMKFSVDMSCEPSLSLIYFCFTCSAELSLLLVRWLPPCCCPSRSSLTLSLLW
ncbi:hypothetical protein EON64_00215 [archaeon]|nr:MAG: hypothetical protein EON64_00215 [archaeon]